MRFWRFLAPKRSVMNRRSISFTSPNGEWLKAQVESKGCSIKSELLNDLIRQARNHKQKLIGSEKRGCTSDSQEQILKEAKSMLNGEV
jgi:antitoxin ParD1/3/4